MHFITSIDGVDIPADIPIIIGGGSGIIGSLLFIIPFNFFLSYSLFPIQFCSIFIIPFQVRRVTLVTSTMQFD